MPIDDRTSSQNMVTIKNFGTTMLAHTVPLINVFQLILIPEPPPVAMCLDILLSFIPDLVCNVFEHSLFHFINISNIGTI